MAISPYPVMRAILASSSAGSTGQPPLEQGLALGPAFGS
jgi:hypothetical protein